MSLMAGITNPTKLGGIFGLSCYLLLQGKVRELVPKDSPNQQTPIFMGHGDADPVVRYAWGKATADKLKDWGWNVDFRYVRAQKDMGLFIFAIYLLGKLTVLHQDIQEFAT